MKHCHTCKHSDSFGLPDCVIPNACTTDGMKHWEPLNPPAKQHITTDNKQTLVNALSRIDELELKNAKLVEALKKADEFITNGIDLGFILMPDKDTPDTAHQTPGIVRAAIVAAEGG